MAPQPRRQPPQARGDRQPAQRRQASTQPERVALMQTIANQQEALASDHRRIAALEEAVHALSVAAGFEGHETIHNVSQQRRTAVVVTADENNPAQPIPDPPSVPPAPEMSSQVAIPPTAQDNPMAPGGSPLTDIAPDAVTAPGQIGVSLDEPIDLNQVDVTAPVQGTEVGGQPHIETDVRIGEPSDQVDQPWMLPGATSSMGPDRFVATLRLARLRIQAGIVPASDDVIMAQAMASDRSLSDSDVATETRTLTAVLSQAQAQQPQRTAARHLVPQHAAGVGRTVPSLTSQATVASDTGDVETALFE